jgi:hypothetical protein
MPRRQTLNESQEVEAALAQELRQCGCTVRQQARRGGVTADLVVSDPASGSRYAINVKGRFRGEARLEARIDRWPSGRLDLAQQRQLVELLQRCLHSFHQQLQEATTPTQTQINLHELLHSLLVRHELMLRLRNYRDRTGEPLREVGAKTNLTFGYLALVEKGHKSIGLETGQLLFELIGWHPTGPPVPPPPRTERERALARLTRQAAKLSPGSIAIVTKLARSLQDQDATSSS